MTVLTSDQVSESAMIAFLRQEYVRYNELLLKVHTSLDSLYSAVKGDTVMSEVLEATYNALLHNEVPLELKVCILIATHFIIALLYIPHFRQRYYCIHYLNHLCQNVAYSSNKPLGSWIENLIKRVEFIGRWIDLVKNSEKALSRQQSRSSSNALLPSDQPRAFWLPAFYFPQGTYNFNYFLTAPY